MQKTKADCISSLKCTDTESSTAARAGPSPPGHVRPQAHARTSKDGPQESALPSSSHGSDVPKVSEPQF